jgi:RAI1 like PD-(D/E)XK nuclease
LIIGGEVDAGTLQSLPPPFNYQKPKITLFTKHPRTPQTPILHPSLGLTPSFLQNLVWDLKPASPSQHPINYVELKTAADPSASDRDVVKFQRKLLKFWAQSFLLGVPKIIVGFRTKEGILTRLEELDTQAIPEMVSKSGKGRALWDGNVCINFAAGFLECKLGLLVDFCYCRVYGSGEKHVLTMSCVCVRVYRAQVNHCQ